jgi:carboxymethylenebutenolidase
MFPEAIKAVVLFYGSGETDFSKVRARFQGHFGGQDEWTPQPEIQFMEEAFRSNDVPYQFFTYPDARHWFIETDRPEYREQDAALAWERTVKFLRDELERA